MNTQDSFGRVDWLTKSLGDLPPLILHIREQSLPSIHASTEPRVSGSKERTLAPLHIDPLDDADALWGKVCSLAIDYADRSGNWRELPDLIDRQWRIPTSAEFAVIGFASSDPDRIYSDVTEMTRYLIAHAFTLAVNSEYTVPVDDLVAAIKRARARYPGAQEPRKSHRHRCPKCLKHAVVPVYSDTGVILALSCEQCGARRSFEVGHG